MFALYALSLGEFTSVFPDTLLLWLGCSKSTFQRSVLKGHHLGAQSFKTLGAIVILSVGTKVNTAASPHRSQGLFPILHAFIIGFPFITLVSP